MKYLTQFKVTKTGMFIIIEDTRITDTHHSRPIPSNLKQPGQFRDQINDKVKFEEEFQSFRNQDEHSDSEKQTSEQFE